MKDCTRGMIVVPVDLLADGIVLVFRDVTRENRQNRHSSSPVSSWLRENTDHATRSRALGLTFASVS
jgi:hypothetical protein